MTKCYELGAISDTTNKLCKILDSKQEKADPDKNVLEQCKHSMKIVKVNV